LQKTGLVIEPLQQDQQEHNFLEISNSIPDSSPVQTNLGEGQTVSQWTFTNGSLMCSDACFRITSWISINHDIGVDAVYLENKERQASASASKLCAIPEISPNCFLRQRLPEVRDFNTG